MRSGFQTSASSRITLLGEPKSVLLFIVTELPNAGQFLDCGLNNRIRLLAANPIEPLKVNSITLRLQTFF
jgi:hypothetical protein